MVQKSLLSGFGLAVIFKRLPILASFFMERLNVYGVLFLSIDYLKMTLADLW